MLKKKPNKFNIGDRVISISDKKHYEVIEITVTNSHLNYCRFKNLENNKVTNMWDAMFEIDQSYYRDKKIEEILEDAN